MSQFAERTANYQSTLRSSKCWGERWDNN